MAERAAMDQKTFYGLVRALSAEHQRASEAAPFIALGLLLAGAVCGALLARWIFRGGLSRLMASGPLRNG